MYNRTPYDPDLRHDPARRHAARGDLALVRRQARGSRSGSTSSGVTFIEGGWPGSNPKDAEFFERARGHDVAARRSSPPSAPPAAWAAGPEDDANIKALLDSGAPVCTVVGKTWTLHVTDVLRTTLEENLRIIEKSLAYLAAAGAAGDLRRRALLRRLPGRPGLRARDAEGGGARRGRDARALRHERRLAAVADRRGGAGGEGRGEARRSASTPTTTARRRSRTRSPRCTEGAIQIQGTVNGYGERCGNANLCSIIPALELKLGMRCLPEGHLHDAHRGRRTSSPRSPTWRPTSTCPTSASRPSPTRAASTSPRCAATRPRTSTSIPELVGNQHARGGERALRARQPALQGRGVRASPAGDVGGVLERDQGARGEGLLVRGRRGLGGA